MTGAPSRLSVQPMAGSHGDIPLKVGRLLLPNRWNKFLHYRVTGAGKFPGVTSSLLVLIFTCFFSLFGKYLLSTCYMPDPDLEARVFEGNKASMPALGELPSKPRRGHRVHICTNTYFTDVFYAMKKCRELQGCIIRPPVL